jgi:hypothetical protein
VAYVTEATGERRRNQLRLTNWRGQNDWGPVKNLPDNTPAIGIPGQQLPPNQLEHMMFDPLWSANGRSIYVPAFVLTQIETDFAILERADATNGDSTFVAELPGAIDAFQSPDRQAAVFTVGSPRGDIRLIARPLDPEAAADRYAWAETHDVAISEAPTWAPDSQALAYVRCSLETSQRCDLALLAPGQGEPAVLIPDLFGSETPDRNPAPFVAWGK